MNEYGKLIIASIVAISLFVIFLSVRINEAEGVFQILGVSGIWGEVDLEQGSSEIVESNANINNPSIIWNEEVYVIAVGDVISIPTLFQAVADNGEELEVNILGISFEGAEILLKDSEEGTKQYQQDVEQFVFEDIGSYQVLVYAVDEYGNDTIKECNLIVNK